ncbi:Xaa-Pro dipeptidyl-peptidase-like domain [Dillenia turbinata]|uniref:Xaa-Pro dipeptidyl-peptidase-like domain n=1 Tax=Dillenia turbinata TaxID=194707 RepID=A0AAN8ZL72_9MAGN
MGISHFGEFVERKRRVPVGATEIIEFATVGEDENNDIGLAKNVLFTGFLDEAISTFGEASLIGGGGGLIYYIYQIDSSSLISIFFASLHFQTSLSFSIESATIPSADGLTMQANIFKPTNDYSPIDNLVIVLVHPYSILGGCQALLRGIAIGLSNKGYLAVTFDLRGVGRCTGRASFTGSSEIRDVVAVCNWVSQNLSSNRILLVGSSAGCKASFENTMSKVLSLGGSGDGSRNVPISLVATSKEVFILLFAQVNLLLDNSFGSPLSVLWWNLCLALQRLQTQAVGAPISGSAVDLIDQVVGYVSLGYPFGLTASVLFGRHHKAILQSPKPKLFVMGTKDGFTRVKQLENKLKSAAGRVETHLIEGASHFQNGRACL